jgi:AcrR family transcriptional regulator
VPRSAAANHELREASRARILDAALTLFAERGYASTPVDAIVAAAGSPRAALPLLPSKLDLLRASSRRR